MGDLVWSPFTVTELQGNQLKTLPYINSKHNEPFCENGGCAWHSATISWNCIWKKTLFRLLCNTWKNLQIVHWNEWNHFFYIRTYSIIIIFWSVPNALISKSIPLLPSAPASVWCLLFLFYESDIHRTEKVSLKVHSFENKYF